MTLAIPATPTTVGSDLDGEIRSVVAQRLGVFAVGWLVPTVIWTAALFQRSARARVPAILTLAAQAGALGFALLASRHDRARAHIDGVVFGLAFFLSLSSIALFVRAGSAGEILGFVLFTLCALSAVLFPWGWRAELTLTAGVLGLFALSFPWIRFLLSAAELAPVIAIAAALCVAIAEGNARGARAAIARRRSEEQALRALAESRDTYRDLAENARDVIWATDLEGRLTYVNEAGARIVGATPAELIGRNVVAFVTDHPADSSPAAMRALLATGVSLPPTLVEWRTARGRSWMETVAYAVRGPDGDVIGIRGISRDVTERCAAEGALRENEARYRGLLESQEALIYRADLAGRLTYINEACRRKYGVMHEPIEALSFLTFVHPDDVPQSQVALRGVAKGGRYRRTSRGRTPDGWRWIEWEVCAITDGAGTVTEIQGVGHDVTERRAADEALQQSLAALREREAELRSMGLQQVAIREEERKRMSFDLHDGVCQELVGIGILIESARQRGVSEAADPALVRAQSHLRKIGEHLRNLARELRPLQLADLGLEECLRALAAGMATATVDITVDFPTPIPRLGEEIEVAVYRIAQEAIANALRHADAGTVALTLVADDGVLRLEVRDDGRGFAREQLRAAPLGLVAMEERAASLGGGLRVISELGAGTTVRAECPLDAR